MNSDISILDSDSVHKLHDYGISRREFIEHAENLIDLSAKIEVKSNSLSYDNAHDNLKAIMEARGSAENIISKYVDTQSKETLKAYIKEQYGRNLEHLEYGDAASIQNRLNQIDLENPGFMKTLENIKADDGKSVLGLLNTLNCTVNSRYLSVAPPPQVKLPNSLNEIFDAASCGETATCTDDQLKIKARFDDLRLKYSEADGLRKGTNLSDKDILDKYKDFLKSYKATISDFSQSIRDSVTDDQSRFEIVREALDKEIGITPRVFSDGGGHFLETVGNYVRAKVAAADSMAKPVFSGQDEAQYMRDLESHYNRVSDAHMEIKSDMMSFAIAARGLSGLNIDVINIENISHYGISEVEKQIEIAKAEAECCTVPPADTPKREGSVWDASPEELINARAPAHSVPPPAFKP